MKLLKKYSTRTSTGILSKGIYKDKNGALYIVKGNSSEFTYEPYSEYIASKIINALGVKCVDYQLEDKFNFQSINTYGDCFFVSVCKIHNKPLRQFYTYISKGYKFYDTDPLEEYLKLGLSKEWLLNLFVIDALIGNQDRHLNNFDIEEDNGTIRNAPILDLGASLLYDVIDKDLNNKDAIEKSMSKCREFIDEEKSHLSKIKNVKKALNIDKWLDIDTTAIKDVFNKISDDLKSAIGKKRITTIERVVIDRANLLNSLNNQTNPKQIQGAKWANI